MRSIRGRKLAAVLAAALLAASAANAKLAVFVDGRILKVEDARLVGDRIALDLPGGGSLVVPATRVERVITDDELDPATGRAGDTPEVRCPAGWSDEPLPAATPFRAEIAAAAHRAGIHPWLLAAVVQAESGFEPAAVSRAGARGLTQLMPVTAVEYHVRDVWDPAENLRAGAAHLRRLLDRFRSVSLALAAYNSGAATVERAGGVPPYRETRRFVRQVLATFCPGGRLRRGGSPP